MRLGNAVESAADRSSGNLEARYNYYAGDNPDWPYARLATKRRSLRRTAGRPIQC